MFSYRISIVFEFTEMESIPFSLLSKDSHALALLLLIIVNYLFLSILYLMKTDGGFILNVINYNIEANLKNCNKNQ
jgi:hypothetical protein